VLATMPIEEASRVGGYLETKPDGEMVFRASS